MIRKLIVAAALAAGLVATATPASGAVPYSWWCYKSGKANVHVYTPGGVGYWTVYQGYRCVGGFWRDV